MAKYINADALKDYIELWSVGDRRDKKWLLDAVNSEPPADVVEVVRCKDCENYRLDRPLSSKDKDNSHYYCCEQNRYLFVDDYCSYGVRKDDCEND